jgi:hypothetical protein
MHLLKRILSIPSNSDSSSFGDVHVVKGNLNNEQERTFQMGRRNELISQEPIMIQR